MNRIAKFFRDYALARFLLPAGIIAVIFGILTVGPVASRLNYPTTQAAVSRTELYEESHYEDDTRHDATYTVFVRYAVDGVESEEEYGVFPAMQEGQAITINYNPDDPRDIGQPNSMLLPYGVIAVSLSRALFTEMGEAVAKEDWPNMRSLVHTGYSATLLLIIPLAAIMVSVSVPIMELFQVGAFSGDDVVYVARILSVWLISLPFYAIVMLLYNIYASMRKFFRFALVSTAMVAVQCALYYVLSSPALFGLAGVPIADIVYYAVCCLILTFMLRKLIGSFELGKILWTVVRVVIASGVAVAVSLGLGAILPEGIGMIDGIIRIVVCGGVGLVVAFGLCIVMKVPYMNYVTDLVGKVARKLKRSYLQCGIRRDRVRLQLLD